MDTRANQKTKLATPQVMQRITTVIKETDAPSWLSSVPANFGDVAAGSLKADEWWTIFTVYIPVALVSIWGEGTVHPSPEVAGELRKALDHTMSLVSALILSSTCTMTQARAAAYRSHIAKWVSGLADLYPDKDARTNNHMAFHIYDFLLLFGPMHSWWCFPFERLIGQLQRLGHNHKFGSYSNLLSLIYANKFTGQLEATLFRSFLRAGKVKRWLAREDCPPAIKECKSLFDKAYQTKPQDTDLQVDNDFAD